MTTQNEVAVNGGGKQYGTKLTVLGEAAIAGNVLEGTKLDVVEIAAGDGGGGWYEPSAEQTALVGEVWRGEIAAYTLNPLNPKMVDIKGVIPSSDGGFTIRELGVFDRAGTLIGVCNTPDMEKARPDSGAGGKLDVIMHLIVTDANALNIVVKPSLDTVSLANIEYHHNTGRFKVTVRTARQYLGDVTGYQARIEELEGQAENLAVRASEAQAEAESVRQEAKNREAELASAYEEGVESNG